MLDLLPAKGDTNHLLMFGHKRKQDMIIEAPGWRFCPTTLGGMLGVLCDITKGLFPCELFSTIQNTFGKDVVEQKH